MTKFRYLLIGVIGVCVLFLLLSMSGVLQIIGKKTDSASSLNKNNADSSNSLIGSKDDDKYGKANQLILGLHIPGYDSSGRVTSVIKSKHTVLFDNRIYKIKEPIIEFKIMSGKKTTLSPSEINVTADEGIMNIETTVGTLTGNVVIHLDNDIQIKTDSMSYLPEKSVIVTDDDVLIVGEKMIIKGQGLEVDLANARGSIQNNIEMEFGEVGSGDMLDKSVKGSTEKHKKQSIADLFDALEDEENKPGAYVKASGQLVFDMNINAITFHDDVQAVIASMVILADELRVILEADKKKIKKVVANGNVLAMNQDNIAKGNLLVWDAETGIATIEDTNTAEFLNDTILITSKTIRLNQNKGWVEAPTAGKLITKSNLSLLGSTNSSPYQYEDKETSNEWFFSLNNIDNQMEIADYHQKYKNMRNQFLVDDNHRQNNVTVTWEGRMFFKNSEHLAEFEEGVKVVKEGSEMSSEKLSITFDENNNIESIVATGKVNISEQKRNYVTDVEADIMTWGKDNKPIELIGDPAATIKLGNKQLSSSKILIFDNGNIISAENEGNIVINSNSQVGGNKRKTGYIYLEWHGNMVFNSKKRKASFYDRIKAFKDGLNIQCDVFDVFFDAEENVEKIVALGNVYVSSDILANLEGLGTMLTWDITENIAVLTGDPVAELRKDGSRTLAKRVLFDIDSRRVTWEGRTQWQIMREDENSKDSRVKKKQNKFEALQGEIDY
ncbi:MAG: LPS export ABC transporter periplasmic protein LptC [Candidatus Anammoxibacter sp.]